MMYFGSCPSHDARYWLAVEIKGAGNLWNMMQDDGFAGDEFTSVILGYCRDALPSWLLPERESSSGSHIQPPASLPLSCNRPSGNAPTSRARFEATHAQIDETHLLQSPIRKAHLDRRSISCDRLSGECRGTRPSGFKMDVATSSTTLIQIFTLTVARVRKTLMQTFSTLKWAAYVVVVFGDGSVPSYFGCCVI
ncbi:hypothetical protein MRB53_021362 [Persea americana]|uniref:Uncharacterized protein n=1 Tax=Persea americana TaxID=3435 RepID=A0ACC2L470_PERAE|nr:hypothetical protein MRB53_021362 [Persea americana]